MRADARGEKIIKFTGRESNLSLIIRGMETSTLDLAYLEIEPCTKQPSACIYVKGSVGNDCAGVTADKLLTSQCLNFVALDAEIRRLHAELEEIRARAKKKFYSAESAAAAGAA